MLRFVTIYVDLDVKQKHTQSPKIWLKIPYRFLLVKIYTELAIPNIHINLQNKNGSTPLYLAAQEGHVEVVKSFLKHKDIDVNLQIEGSTLLHIAAQQGHVEVVQALLSARNIDVNPKGYSDCTPLYVAAYNGHAKVVKVLLSAKNIQVNSKHKDGSTPLDVAKKNSHLLCVNLLENAIKLIH